MTEVSPTTEAGNPQQAAVSLEPPFLGQPGSASRWLLPVTVCVGLTALGLLLFVFVPLHMDLSREPDLRIRAVMADHLLLLHIRLWPMLGMAAMFGAAVSVAGSRRNNRALLRLEMRLRRIAGGEVDDTPYQPGLEFTGFEDVVNSLYYVIERTNKRSHGLLQQARQVQSPIKRLSLRLAAEEIPRTELRRTLSEILAAFDSLLEADRRTAAGGKVKT
jgi:HAMP domain-containing protein